MRASIPHTGALAFEVKSTWMCFEKVCLGVPVVNSSELTASSWRGASGALKAYSKMVHGTGLSFKVA